MSAKHLTLVSCLQYYTNCDNDTVYLTRGVSIHGLQYRAGCALVTEYSDEDEPVFGILNEVAVVDHIKYFVIDTLVTAYNLHTLSYVIESVDVRILLPFTALKFKWPLSVYTYKGRRAIMNVNSHTYSFPF